jgi:hypothetical protein
VLLKSQAFCEIIGRTALKLEEVYFAKYADVPDGWITAGILGRIKRVDSQFAKMHDYDRLMPHYLSLQDFRAHLGLMDISMTWPTQDTPKITLNYLSKLELHCDDLPSFSQLEMPVLSELILTSKYSPPLSTQSTLPLSLALPTQDFSIKLLELVDLKLYLRSPLCLFYLTLPKLTRLSISSIRAYDEDTARDRDEEAFKLLPHLVHLPSVRFLAVHTLGPDSCIFEALKSCPNCEDFRGSTVTWSKKQFGKELQRELSVVATVPEVVEHEIISFPRLYRQVAGDDQDLVYALIHSPLISPFIDSPLTRDISQVERYMTGLEWSRVTLWWTNEVANRETYDISEADQANSRRRFNYR